MAPSLVQSATGSGTSGTSVTVTLGSGTGAGNCLIAYVGAIQQTDNATVSGITLGGNADNWAAAKTAYNNADANAAIWTDQDCASGQTSVVVSFTGGVGADIEYAVRVEEWSGLAASGAVDKTNSGNGQSTSFSSGATGTLTKADELVVGCVFIAPETTATITGPSAPWTNTTPVSPANGYYLVTGYQVVSADTTQTYSGTSTASGYYGAVIVSLEETSNVTVALGTVAVEVAAQPLGIQHDRAAGHRRGQGRGAARHAGLRARDQRGRGPGGRAAARRQHQRPAGHRGGPGRSAAAHALGDHAHADPLHRHQRR